jgi:hypothetical protein
MDVVLVSIRGSVLVGVPVFVFCLFIWISGGCGGLDKFVCVLYGSRKARCLVFIGLERLFDVLARLGMRSVVRTEC